MRSRTLFLLVAIPAWLMTTGAAAAPLRVVVAIPPLAWFVQQIGGGNAEVAVLLGPGDSPATFEPTPRQMADLAGADLFVGAGLPFERGLRPRIAALASAPRIVGPRPDPHGHDGHGHGHGDHLDPHSWLGPAGAAAIGDTVAAALTALRPALAADFAAGRSALDRTIAAVDARIRAELAGRAGAVFVVFHPAFGHFADAYDLEQLAIEDEGHEPGARHLAEVTASARERGIGAVVVQPQFSRRAAEAVAASLGVPVVTLDPLARDWEANMIRIARTLAPVLGDPPGTKEQP